MHAHLRSTLQSIKGVHWAEINGVLGRVVVSFDEGSINPDSLVEIVQEVEEAHLVHEERFGHDREDHPADRVGSRRALLALVSDVGGLGISFAGSALRRSPIPVEVASAVSLVDGIPRLRRVIEERLGPTITDIGLATTNAVAQGLGAGPFGLLVDMAQRATALTESRAEERCYEQQIEELHEPGAIHEPVHREPRPLPIPGGPVERYSDRAGLATMGGMAAVLAATLDPRRASAMVMAGNPKAARIGREGFAAQVGRTFSRRRIVVVDQRLLRRLDRVDTLVVESDLLLSGRSQIRRVLLADGADHVLVHRRLATMFDGSHPGEVVRHKGWSVGPLEKLDAEQSRQVKRLVLQLGDSPRYGVVREGEVLALFSVADELAGGVVELMQTARQAGLMIAVAGDDMEIVRRLDAHLLVASRADCAGSIRTLQKDGCVVALVAGGEHASEALAAADCGIGIVLADEPVPWASDLICRNGLADAAFVASAIAMAKEASRQSAALAFAGSGVAATIALLSPPMLAAARASTAVNATSLLSLVNGTRVGVALAGRPEPRSTAPRWHELSSDEVLATLSASADGLPEQVARQRLQPEAQPVPAPLQLSRNILQELANPLTPVLAAGSALSAAVGSTVDAAIVAGVAGLGSVIGGVQRFQAERAVSVLESRTAPSARVRRPGAELQTIDAGRLVVGDVITLEAGDAVPADCRILEAQDLEVDESSVTGEAAPVPKGTLPVFAPVIADRSSMLYEGTTVAAGEAAAVVVATGGSTEAGSALWAAPPAPSAGVEMRLRELTAMTLPFAAAGGAAVLGAGMLRGQPLNATLGPAVSLAVAAIPEGLPVLATAAQLAAARRLSKHDTVVRNPRALEALGRVEVLCADKTGTLTAGRIELQAVIVDHHSRRNVRDLLAAAGGLGSSDPGSSARRSVLAGALRASPQRNGHRPLPHMTDEAIVRGGRRLGVEEGDGLSGWIRRDELPFEPSRGYHATLGSAAPEADADADAGDGAGDGAVVLAVKGAPEELLRRCKRRLDPTGRRVALDAPARRRLARLVDEVARRGLRVLAVAERRFPGDGDHPAPSKIADEDVRELDFLGYVALADPVRTTAAEAVRGIHAAGVRVVMVTGDHPSTAEGIAAELGLLNGHRVVTGAELAQMSDAELDELLPDISVFARVDPSDKVRIVTAYRRAGRTVAMTGDGANDAPAIRLADVGLAIGKHCTAAARDAADVVIADDRIETIVDAIIEGRALWAAVRDAVAILLGGNIGEIVFTAGAAAVSGRSPLNARQLLLVNLLTDVAPALTVAVRPPAHATPEQLAAEGPELSLAGPLRKAIMLRAVTTAGGATGAWTIASLTGRPHRASTTALVALVATQLGQTITSSHKHPQTIAAAVGSAVLLAGIVQTPGMSQLFGCTPLGPVAWTTALGSATAATAISAAVAPVVQRAGIR